MKQIYHIEVGDGNMTGGKEYQVQALEAETHFSQSGVLVHVLIPKLRI